MNKEAYIRKSHSFTKESLEHLGILSSYMGDIGESAVLRYLIINEIRKVPAFFKAPIKSEQLKELFGAIKDHSEGLDDDAISRVLFEGDDNK